MGLFQAVAPIEHDGEVFHVHRFAGEDLIE